MIDDELRTRFTELTDDRPEPADPAPAIRLRIKRRQRRRRGSATVLVTAAAVALSLAAGPALGALRSGTASDTDGFAAAPAPLSASGKNATTHNKVLPPPWSDKEFTKMPEANIYRPAYYVAEGSIPTEKWAVLSFRESCLVAEEGQANSFGRPLFCFTNWAAGRKVDYKVVQGRVTEKNSPKVDHTLVLGATSIEARKVRITANGKTYFANAVGTPTTDRLRFFALDINQRDLKITSIVPVDGAGRPVGPPNNPPKPQTCEACTPATPAGAK